MCVRWNNVGCKIVLRVIEEINSRLKFLYRKNRFLDVPLCRHLCNALIQPHFDYAYTTWYPNLSKKLKDKLQITQNKCIGFCLKLQSREHISNEPFHTLNWLLLVQTMSRLFKFVQNKCPVYTNEVFRLAENMRINTKNSFLKLNHPFRNTSTGQKGLSYIGPAIWNRIPEIIKKTRNLNTFKHKMKHYYLNDLSNPNLWNVGRFDYALAIIKNIFLFVKQIFLHHFFSCFTLIEGPQWK